VTKDMQEFVLMLSVLVLLFILIGIFIKILTRKLSRWHDLAAAFPLPESIPETKKFKYCPGRAGNISFSGRKNGFTLSFIPMGIVIKSKVSKQPDLLVPWKKIRSAEKYAMRSKVAAKVEIDSNVPLHFFISGDALSAFETWHSTEMKTIEQFKDELFAKNRK